MFNAYPDNGRLSENEFAVFKALLTQLPGLHCFSSDCNYFLGFEDPSYFNRFFKADTGITAVAFRKGQTTEQPKTQ